MIAVRTVGGIDSNRGAGNRQVGECDVVSVDQIEHVTAVRQVGSVERGGVRGADGALDAYPRVVMLEHDVRGQFVTAGVDINDVAGFEVVGGQ